MLYFGGGVHSLAGGSDDPVGQVLNAGDSFLWNITAQNGSFWDVVTGGTFFPLMAFATQESGLRRGDWTLNLYRNGATVFNIFENDSPQECVHVGTNGIPLNTGLQFDRMELTYLLNSANETDGSCGGVADGPEIETTLAAALPIFGTPEDNRFAPGIVYTATVVPEPSTFALALVGLGAVGIVARQRRRSRV